MALPVHAGKVQHVARSHGFLEWQAGGESQPRIFYQAFDVEGNAELSKGDEVTVTVADKVWASLHACLTRNATLPEQPQPMLPHVDETPLREYVSSRRVPPFGVCLVFQSAITVMCLGSGHGAVGPCACVPAKAASILSVA